MCKHRVIVLLVALICMCPAYGQAAQGGEDHGPYTVSGGRTDRPLDGSWTTQHCLLEAHMVVDLSSPVTGVIARMKADRGDEVRKGEVVVQLRSELERAIVELNQAQVKFGDTTAARNQELYEQQLISAQERDELILNSEVSRLELAAARVRVRQKDIASPINGIVLERLMEPGEYVGEDPILKIASLDPLYVEAVLPMELFGTIHEDAVAEVGLGPPIEALYEARVSVVDKVIDAASGTFRVRLILPNPDNAIPVGLKCKLRFPPDGAADR